MPPRYITAAVVRQASGPFRLEPATLRGPGTDEVIVEVKATGMCHADIVVLDAATAEEAVAELAPVLYVFKRGRMTVSRERARLHRPH